MVHQSKTSAVNGEMHMGTTNGSQSDMCWMRNSTVTAFLIHFIFTGAHSICVPKAVQERKVAYTTVQIYQLCVIMLTLLTQLHQELVSMLYYTLYAVSTFTYRPYSTLTF